MWHGCVCGGMRHAARAVGCGLPGVERFSTVGDVVLFQQVILHRSGSCQFTAWIPGSPHVASLLLRPRMTKTPMRPPIVNISDLAERFHSLFRHFPASWAEIPAKCQPWRLAESQHAFVILGRSRSEATCGDPGIHAVTWQPPLRSNATQTSAPACHHLSPTRVDSCPHFSTPLQSSRTIPPSPLRDLVRTGYQEGRR